MLNWNGLPFLRLCAVLVFGLAGLSPHALAGGRDNTGSFGPAKLFSAAWGNSSFQRVVCDFNGDGKDDILVRHPTAGDWSVKLSTGSATGAGVLWADNWAADTVNYQRVVGDFNGDRKCDIGVRHVPTGAWIVRLSTGSSFGAAQTLSAAGWGAGANWSPFTGDFNGDGRIDIGLRSTVATDGRWAVRTSTSSTGLALRASALWSPSWAGNTAVFQALVGDWNGDGKDDIAVRNVTLGTWLVKLSTGTAFGAAVQWSGPWGIGTAYQIMAGDWNGDGKSDIGLRNMTTLDWYVRFSNGTAFATTSIWADNWAGTSYQRHVGDFNGDRRTDIMVFNITSSTWAVRLSQAPVNPATAAFWRKVPMGPGHNGLMAAIIDNACANGFYTDVYCPAAAKAKGAQTELVDSAPYTNDEVIAAIDDLQGFTASVSTRNHDLNGCSALDGFNGAFIAPGGAWQNADNAWFKRACLNHDQCYQHGWETNWGKQAWGNLVGGNLGNKLHCDASFQNDMNATCQKTVGGSAPIAVCNTMAAVFRNAVDVLGASSHYKTKNTNDLNQTMPCVPKIGPVTTTGVIGTTQKINAPLASPDTNCGTDPPPPPQTPRLNCWCSGYNRAGVATFLHVGESICAGGGGGTTGFTQTCTAGWNASPRYYRTVIVNSGSCQNPAPGSFSGWQAGVADPSHPVSQSHFCPGQ